MDQRSAAAVRLRTPPRHHCGGSSGVLPYLRLSRRTNIVKSPPYLSLSITIVSIPVTTTVASFPLHHRVLSLSSSSPHHRRAFVHHHPSTTSDDERCINTNHIAASDSIVTTTSPPSFVLHFSPSPSIFPSLHRSALSLLSSIDGAATTAPLRRISLPFSPHFRSLPLSLSLFLSSFSPFSLQKLFFYLPSESVKRR